MKKRDSLPVALDASLCVGCGQCVSVCPADTFELREGKAVVTGLHCISCDHCASSCPIGAIRVDGLDADAFAFKTLGSNSELRSLVQLMRSRRSCRQYEKRDVDRSLLEDLVRIGISAPSGTNSQKWTFTVLPTRKATLAFATRVADFFRKLNGLASNPFLRTALRCLGKPELANYHRRYRPLVEKTLSEWAAGGRERLFHGAPAVIVVAEKPGASTPAEDALLATQNILLAAHAMGLGTCLIGFAVSAMAKDKALQESIGIPKDEKVYAVIALGHPDQTYVRCAGRKAFTLRWCEG